MIRTRGRGTVRVTEVQGHATDADVEQGRVRLVDQLENAEADTAADLGGRRQSELRMDAGRSLPKVRTRWYPIMQQLHRFMIAVSSVAVNHDGKGGSAPDPLVWDQGGRRKVVRTDIRVDVDLASLPWPHGFLTGPWMQVHGGGKTGADIAAWPYNVGILFKFTAFLGTSHWAVDTVDMGHLGVPIWRFLSFSSNGPVIGCSVKRLRGRICVLIVLFLFPLCLYPGELKFDMVVNSSVVWLGLWPVVWVGSCHVMLALTCPGYVILDGIIVLMVSLPGHWNLVTINVLRLYVGFWAIPMVQRWSFLMAL